MRLSGRQWGPRAGGGEAAGQVGLASWTELKTGSPKCSWPPFFGVTPPTTFVPYARACSLWNVPCFPVNLRTSTRVRKKVASCHARAGGTHPWQMTLVSLLIHTLADAEKVRAATSGRAARA